MTSENENMMNQAIDVADKSIMPMMRIEKQNPEARDKVLISYDKVKYEPFRISKTEKLVCEVMVETGSLKACIEACQRVYKRNIQYRTIKHWISKRPLVREYMLELMERKGQTMSEGEWEARVSEAARGDKKLNRTTPMMYKLYAEKKGWLKEQVGKVETHNIQVNILQQNGMA